MARRWRARPCGAHRAEPRAAVDFHCRGPARRDDHSDRGESATLTIEGRPMRSLGVWMRMLAAAGLLLASGAAGTQEPPPPAAEVPVQQGAPDDTVTLNFVNADIHAVVKAVAEMTGRNFVIDPRVQGTVNIIAPKTVRGGWWFLFCMGRCGV